MSVPNELPDIGSTSQRLRQNPRFDPVAGGMGPEEYFVWTRFDGATTLKDLILMTGFDTPKAVGLVSRLRGMGAILLPDERPEQVTIKPAKPPTAPIPSASPAGKPRPRPDADDVPTIERLPPGAVTLGKPADVDDTKPTTRIAASQIVPRAAEAAMRQAFQPTSSAERAALTEDIELSPEERARILEMHRRVPEGDAILGVADLADRKAIKRAYFALSKEFHPDRFYRRRTGSFAKRLEEIFEAVSRAYENLSEGRARRDTSGEYAPAQPSTPPSPVDYAADLFERACQAEVHGDLPGALRLFASALRVDAPARYLRRAARCAVNAHELRVALEYAKKAANLEPNDVSTARVLAYVFKALGKFSDAEEVLVLAMMIKTENDQLAHELQSDLAEVRRLVARS